MQKQITARLPLTVQPGAARSEVVGWRGDALRVRVAAPPVGGRANAAVAETVASWLGARRGDISIVKGHKSRNKIIEVAGIGTDELHRRLVERGVPGGVNLSRS